jgi:hypothetical protein
MATIHSQERNGGNYGSGTQELQRRNYVEKKEVRPQLGFVLFP